MIALSLYFSKSGKFLHRSETQTSGEHRCGMSHSTEIPDAAEYIMVKTIAQGIDILSTDSVYPVSVWQLHRYLSENCEEARGEAASTFFKTSVPKALDQMIATGMLQTKAQGFSLTKHGRWSLLAPVGRSETVIPDEDDNDAEPAADVTSSNAARAGVCHAPTTLPAQVTEGVDYTQHGVQLTDLVRSIFAKRGHAPPRTCPGYISDLYLGSLLERVVEAGDDTLPYFGMGRSLPGDKRALIRQILDALVRAHALELRKEKVRKPHRKMYSFQYYELGRNASARMTIEIECNSEG
jgi:hypothetical protein